MGKKSLTVAFLEEPAYMGNQAVLILFFMLIDAVAGYGLPADWPQFRGPNGTGVSLDTGLPAQMGPDRNVVWKTPLPPGHSSPVLSGKWIFLTAIDGKKLLTICLDQKTGEIAWTREAPRPRVQPLNSTNNPASPTPVSDGNNVYVFFGDFGIICYTADGRERWRVSLGPFNNPNGPASSPILVDDLIVLVCDQETDSYVIALDKNDGHVRWKTERPEVTRGFGTPAVYRPEKGTPELIVPGAYQLIGYSAANGQKLWWVRGLSWQFKGVPVIDGETIYVNSWESGGDVERTTETPTFEEMLAKYGVNKDSKLPLNEALAQFRSSDLNHDGYLDAREWSFYRATREAQNSTMAVRYGGRGDLTDTNVLWRYRKSLPNVPSPLLYRNVLYLVKDGGVLTALNPKTGEVFKQARLDGAREPYYSSPVAADGKVYLLSEGCKLTVLKAIAEWEVLAVNDLEDACYATPAIADSRLYVRTRSFLYCFGQR
jgi:outer membrane protein assembly factor BamB